MVRLHITEKDNYAKATSDMLLSIVQKTIDLEMENSNVLVRAIDDPLPPNEVIIYDVAESDDNADSDQPRQLRQPTTASSSIPEFHVSEIITGHTLGRGGFCYVAELNEIRLLTSKTNKKNNKINILTSKQSVASKDCFCIDDNNSSCSYNVSCNQVPLADLTQNNASCYSRYNNMTNQMNNGQREHLARRVWSKQANKYVVKQVDSSFLTSAAATASNMSVHEKKVQLMRATVDIMLEAKYLQSLSHPHIISVVGVVTSMNGLDASTATMNHNKSSSNTVVTNHSTASYLSHHSYTASLRYGILFEKLPIMLSARLNDWMQEERRTSGVTGFILCRNKKERIKNLLRERLFVVLDIAEALDYLHSKNIIYRDLKADNIGFDYDGILKIFDFGLAKELKCEDQDEHGLYRNMTPFTGALRYMAPEVGLGQAYNLKADVYSWSMLFWYVMALEPPMGTYSPTMFQERVFKDHYRPALSVKWSPNVTLLMEQCWDREIHKRPNFGTILGKLRTEIKGIDPEVQGIFNESMHSNPSPATT